MKYQQNDIIERINQILNDNLNMLPNNQEVSYDSVLLEDSMKKFAVKNNIDAYDIDLSAVVNSLKSKGLLKGHKLV